MKSQVGHEEFYSILFLSVVGSHWIVLNRDNIIYFFILKYCDLWKTKFKY